MVVHIALAKWKPHTSQQEIDLLLDAIRNLKGQIPSLLDIQCGENFSKHNLGYTHAVVSKFRDRVGLEEYRKHKAHVPVGQMWDRIEDVGIAIDFETD